MRQRVNQRRIDSQKRIEQVSDADSVGFRDQAEKFRLLLQIQGDNSFSEKSNLAESAVAKLPRLVIYIEFGSGEVLERDGAATDFKGNFVFIGII